MDETKIIERRKLRKLNEYFLNYFRWVLRDTVLAHSAALIIFSIFFFQ